jgi:2-octaprenyl-6-methoxyphenol hydroxylase
MNTHCEGWFLNEQSEFEVVVVGAGPAGLLAGLCCAASDLQTAVIGPLADNKDGRTAALLNGSVNLLKRLGIWENIEAASEPLSAIRLVDATGSLLRAPEVLFEASEIGLEAFGYNVPNAVLTSALDAAAGTRLTRLVSDGVTNLDLGDKHARVSTREGGSVTAQLVVAADGRASASRTAAGIAVSSWSYSQAAIVTTFAHSRPHHGISTELHRHSGPLTVVPGPSNTSSLVWVETPDEAMRLLALNESDFSGALETHLDGLLGTLSAFAPRRSFPLAGQTAAVMAKNRVALVGEAAHMMPPIGAQGLNLSFRDAATLAEVAGDAKRSSEDLGGVLALARYGRLRKGDVTSRVFAVDLLNRALLSAIPGIHFARGMGLFALAANRTLRARVMREGVMPAMAHPALMLPLPQSGEIAGPVLDAKLQQQA